MSRELHTEEGSSEAEQFWERHYRAHERLWSGRPNPVLVDVAEPLTAGTALDLGCGEGGDAIWLSRLGWRVTAVDVSATALERAATHAATVGVETGIDFQQHDLAHTFPNGAFDLVSAQYLQSPVDLPRDRVLRAAAGAVAPAGLMLIVDHGSAPPWAGNPHAHTRFPTPGEVLTALELDPGRWRTELLGSPERQAIGSHGQCATVTDSVVAVRRVAD